MIWWCAQLGLARTASRTVTKGSIFNQMSCFLLFATSAMLLAVEIDQRLFIC